MANLTVFEMSIEALLILAFICALGSAAMYVRRKDIPVSIFVPLLLCFCGTLVFLALYVAYGHIVFWGTALVCLIGMLSFIRRERAYRQRFGLDWPYEHIARELRAKVQLRKTLRK